MGIDVDRDLEFYPAIDKIMAKLKELEDKIDSVKSDIGLVKSNTELMIKSSNKKESLSHSQQIPAKGNHDHTKKVK